LSKSSIISKKMFQFHKHPLKAFQILVQLRNPHKSATATIQILPLRLKECLNTARCVAKAYFAYDGTESTAAKRRRTISLFGPKRYGVTVQEFIIELQYIYSSDRPLRQGTASNLLNSPSIWLPTLVVHLTRYCTLISPRVANSSLRTH